MGRLDRAHGACVRQDEELHVERPARCVDQADDQRADLNARQRGCDDHGGIGDHVREHCATSARREVAGEDALEVGHRRTTNHHVVVVVPGRFDAPVDAADHRDRVVGDQQLDVIDHEAAHRVVDDADARRAQAHRSACAVLLGGIVDHRDRHAAAVRRDQRVGQLRLAQLVDLNLDIESRRVDHRAELGERRRSAAQQGQGVGARPHRSRRPQQRRWQRRAGRASGRASTGRLHRGRCPDQEAGAPVSPGHSARTISQIRVYSSDNSAAPPDIAPGASVIVRLDPAGDVATGVLLIAPR